MDEKGKVTYTFELKDLSYSDLYAVYIEMVNFLKYLNVEKNNAQVVKDGDIQ